MYGHIEPIRPHGQNDSISYSISNHTAPTHTRETYTHNNNS